MNKSFQLTTQQSQVLKICESKKVFLSGSAGTGKTTVGLHWITKLVQAGESAGSILVLAPQRSLAKRYYELVSNPEFPSGGSPTIVTFGGLAQRTVDLFWPEISREAGFSNPARPPIFLTLETAQYFLARTIKPLLEKGYFENLVIDRNRLYSQILDNLNKAALTGIPLDSISERLKSAWIGEESRLIAYDQMQEAVNLFRQFCLKNNLLDFSLQVEVFQKHLWHWFLVSSYLRNKYKHLVFENVEEESPVCHDLFREWLPGFQTALLIYDTDAGYRTFLGADPESGLSLSANLEHFNFTQSFNTSQEILDLRFSLTEVIQKKTPEIPPSIDLVYSINPSQYVPEMTGWVSEKIQELVTQKSVPPGEIVVLAPYLSDALRFSLATNLEKLEIPVKSNRPSRALRDEPATQMLITLARIAFPSWGMKPDKSEVRQAFMQILTEGDLIRADLLAQVLYSPTRPDQPFGNFDSINSDMQQRITFSIGNKFENLKTWLMQNYDHPEMDLDVFWSRLFGEVLSQPGFGLHHSYDAARTIANLIESFQKFRKVNESCNSAIDQPIAKEFIQFVREGVIAAQYLSNPNLEDHNAVLVAPAYSFLLKNQPVKVQFWLDIGSTGWWQRPDQPLTHPYVLSRHWQADRKWTDADELMASQDALARLAGGLLSRCSSQIIVCPISLNERGMEERGPLLIAFNKLIKLSTSTEVPNG